MLAGHYSASLVAKSLRPETPLWVLCIAAQLIDIIWASLVFLNIERVRIEPALPSVPLELYYMPYSHSLVGAIVWSMLALALCRCAGGRMKDATVVIAAVVLSHWFLDLIVHRPDLPLYDNVHKLGFALWDHPTASVAVEAGLLLAGLVLLLRSSAFASRVRRLGLIIGATTLCLLTAAIAFDLLTVPTEVPQVVSGQLLLYALVAFGAWLLESKSTRG